MKSMLRIISLKHRIILLFVTHKHSPFSLSLPHARTIPHFLELTRSAVLHYFTFLPHSIGSLAFSILASTFSLCSKFISILLFSQHCRATRYEDALKDMGMKAACFNFDVMAVRCFESVTFNVDVDVRVSKKKISCNAQVL